MLNGAPTLRVSGLRPRTRPGAGTTAFGAAQEQAFAVLLGLAMTGLPVALTFVGQPVAVLACLALAALVAARLEPAVPTALIAAYAFQTSFVAYASAYVADERALDAMKSYTFVATVGVWAALAVRFAATRRDASPFVRRLTLAGAGMLALVGLYYVPGLMFDARGATIYLRNLALPLMLFQVGLGVASRHRINLGTGVVVLLAALLACGYFELFFVERWLDLTHGWSYLDLAFADRRASPNAVREARETGAVVGGVLDTLRTNLFNTGLLGDLGTVTRVGGPNFHPISFGYTLSTLAAVAAVLGYWPLAAAALPLMVVVGAKGALVLFVAGLGFAAAARRRPAPSTLALFLLALAAYAAAVLRSGLANGDFHVLGLLGGLSGFAADPLGHSLGQGGNLSVDFAALDFQKFQRAGAASVAVESAVGVLLFQMGVGGLALLAFYGWIASIAWRLHRALGAPSLALAAGLLIVTLVNGLFQEEALFAPLALGLVMLFVGLALGSVDRTVVAARHRSTG